MARNSGSGRSASNTPHTQKSRQAPAAQPKSPPAENSVDSIASRCHLGSAAACCRFSVHRGARKRTITWQRRLGVLEKESHRAHAAINGSPASPETAAARPSSSRPHKETSALWHETQLSDRK